MSTLICGNELRRALEQPVASRVFDRPRMVLGGAFSPVPKVTSQSPCPGQDRCRYGRRFPARCCAPRRNRRRCQGLACGFRAGNQAADRASGRPVNITGFKALEPYRTFGVEFPRMQKRRFRCVRSLADHGYAPSKSPASTLLVTKSNSGRRAELGALSLATKDVAILQPSHIVIERNMETVPSRWTKLPIEQLP